MAKKKAVAYIRVSTASDAQLHSYDFQEQYWRNKLSSEPDTEYVTVYADKGISGRSIEKRPHFLAMMQDAREHKFDVIYTKSVSRFSRNTVDLLEAIRELRDIGIEVIFEKENIHTLQPTSEVFLTIAATIAENDLEVDSERQRWSIRHRIENGWISIGSGMFGYRMNKENELEIVPKEAEVIREIFRRYLAGDGSQKIAAWLAEEGITTKTGKLWNSHAVLGAIQNEKYMGDSLMMKSISRAGEKLDNTGGKYAKQYYIENSHEGIVSKEDWHKAQRLLAERGTKNKRTEPMPVYAFTGIIECGDCGTHFRHKINNSGQKWQTGIWTCGKRLRLNKAACDNTVIKDSVLEEKFIECYNEFVKTKPQGTTMIALQGELEKLRREERELASLQRQHLVPEETYHIEHRHIKAQIRAMMEKISEQRGHEVRESDYTPITQFSEEKVKKFITKVIVKHWTVTFVFYNGVAITKEYTNGEPGNKPGWNKKERS